MRVCVKSDSSRAPVVNRNSDLRARFEEDPIVRAMLQKFGGQISGVKSPGNNNGSQSTAANACAVPAGAGDAREADRRDRASKPRSGGGMVTVKMNGQKQLTDVRIEADIFKSKDQEMLQELVLAAVNEATRRVDDELSKQVKDLTGGLPGMMGMKIPGLFWIWFLRTGWEILTSAQFLFRARSNARPC